MNLTHTLRSPVRGREDDLSFLRDTVAAGRHVVVAGPKGIGKTLLLQHAANTGALSGGVVADDAGLLWLDAAPWGATDILRELVHACYEVDPDTAVPDSLARQLLGDVRALVVLDGVDLPLDEARRVLSAMPRGVFVLSTRRDDLWAVGKQRSLGGLSFDDTLAMVRDELGEPLDVETVANDWDARDGNPLDILERAVVRDSARRLGTVPEGLSDAEALAQVVPIVLDSLTDRAREALRPLVALGDVRWGEQLLSAVCGVPEAHGADKLARKRLAHCEGGRYRVGALVAGFEPPIAESELVSLVERITEWAARALPGVIAGEICVIETALKRTLDAGMHDTALSLARTASAGLVWSRHWGALTTVLGLGLRAAVGAESVHDQISFHYTLAVCRLNDGDNKQAAELAIAAVSLSRDDNDEHLATRVRELNAEVQHLAARQPLSTVDGILARVAEVGSTAAASASAGVKAVRDACVNVLTGMPGGLQLARLVQENPAIVRGAVSMVAVAGLVLATMSASGSHDEATAMPPTSGGTVQGLPVDAPNRSTQPTTTATTPPTGPALTTTPGQASPTGTTSTSGGVAADGQQPGGGNTETPETNTGSRPQIATTWGLVRVWNVDRPIGSSHALSGPTVPNNNEANWTYGPWEMTSPAAGYPTTTHVAVGQQRVRLPAVGAPGGSVKVTTQDYAAWGGSVGYRPGVFCQPSRWYQDGADEVIDVVCFDHSGNPADVPFFLRYIAGSTSGARGFVFDDQPTSATFTPDWTHGVNAGAVTRTGVGRYTADLPGSQGGAVEVTAVGTAPRHCAVTGRRGQLVDVACTAPGGSAADSMFTAAFAVNQNILDDPRKPVGDYLVADDSPTASAPVIHTRWASGNAPMTLERISTGKYKAHFTNGYIRSTMHVTAVGYGNHCSVMQLNDYSYKDDTSIWIACFDSAGTLVNSGFTLLYTSVRIY
ncbi:hypothetical protein ALI22I_18040 [Saccharothrix sp. ALI-22-I]|uniref:ATP-binding protein n=1 Tax=Saccharothrix sp. ALI-22-I TaxID=1933778 RepID=UPI00097BFC34|nr:ATP-binding protein [Saccharothrix sp. ALI-22-I]ONI88863.1 hypothetical protein ALI22I_18040 [Saccharothrix sp. ALI-22-I]